MKKLYLFLGILLTFSIGNVFAQPVIIEEFEYPVGDSLTTHSYTAHSGGTTNAITVRAGNLNYPGYPTAGLGNHIRLVNSGQDVNKTLPADITTGTVYASMLVNIDSARTGDYFFHFGPNPISTTFRARVFVKKALNGNLAFGLSVGSTNATVLPVYTDSVFTAGTTYLVVVSYAFRQGASSSSAFLLLDGLIIGTSWDYVVPVELTSFVASVNGKNVDLSWITATETNNSGFEVERKSANSNWQKVGFVNGNGTTTEKQSYFYSDKNLSEGKYSYRLKQVDFNGTFEYSKVVEVEVVAPNKFELAQNYTKQ